MNSIPVEQPPNRNLSSGRTLFGRIVLDAGILLLLTEIAFILPMRTHFWIGVDDARVIGEGTTFWSSHYNQIAARPLASLGAFIARQLTPGSIEGILFVSVAAWLLIGILIGGIARLLLPKSHTLALIASVLFIVNPSELGRFEVVEFVGGYYTALLFLVLALYLYARSYRTHSVWLLVLACVSLALALQANELGFPLSILGIFFLLVQGRKPHFMLWVIMWLGTLAASVIHFLNFLLSTRDSYQTGYLQRAPQITFQVLASNLLIQTEPLVSFLQITNPGLFYWALSLFLSALIGVLLFLYLREPIYLTGRNFLCGLGLGLLSILLGVLVWVVLPTQGVPGYPTWRTQFYPAPGQAIVWALCILLVATLLNKRWQRIWLACSTSLLILFATANAWDLQLAKGVINRQVDYKTVAHIFYQANALMPPLEKSAILIFTEQEPSPLGADIAIYDLSCLVFGVPGYKGVYVPDQGWSVAGTNSITNFMNVKQVVTFDVKLDGTVKAIPTQPQNSLPSQGASVFPIEPCRFPKAQALSSDQLPFLERQ